MHKEFLKNFLTAIGTCSAFATLISFVFTDMDFCWITGVFILLGILIASLWWAWYSSKRKTSITLSFKNETDVRVEFGDLFSKEGIVVIPVNEFFDTEVGSGVISPKSVHGQFILKVFRNRQDELRKRIDSALLNVPDSFQKNRRLSSTPNIAYPLGTCIDIKEGNCTYVLFAFTEFDIHDKASISPRVVSKTIMKLMNHLDEIAEDNPVYMPVFGNKTSRLNKKAQRMLLYVLETIDFGETPRLVGGLNVECYTKEKNHYDLNAIEDYFNNNILN